MYVTTAHIITEYQLTPREFGFKDTQTATSDLEAIVTRWIQQATDAIDKYLGRTTSYPDGTVPGLVSLACTECVGNIITNRRLRQDNAYIKSDNWTKDVTKLDILDGVREILKPLTLDETRYRNNRVSCFAITSEDFKEEDDKEDESWY